MRILFEKNRTYQLKNGKKVVLENIYEDYYSENKYVIIRDDKNKYISEYSQFKSDILVSNPPFNNPQKRTTQDKINLYRSYFRGNDDVIATSFKTKEGKMVYFPYCHIRKQAPCPKVHKPRFQCSTCTLHRFQKMTDKVIFNHLKGVDKRNKEVLYGIYPMLSDNTVYFLAIDFDEKDWRNEVKIFIEVLKEFNIDYLIEISQSGNGSHIWFFFEDNIPAKTARDFGNQLLKQAMKNYPELSFGSFDRLFPSQNELATGGFGNLIALPLQGKRVLQGFSRFVDDDLEIIDDIWAALEQTKKLSLDFIENIIQRLNKDLPVSYYKSDHNDVEENLSLFDFDKKSALSEEIIDIIVDTKIKINLNDITKHDAVKLKYLASFHNKAYYTALNKRLSTFQIPRIISLSEVHDSYIELPRGLLDNVKELYPNANFIDKTTDGKIIDVRFQGELYDNQKKALSELIKNDMGILSAGTGFGKTIVASKLIADKSVSTLILVHNKNLAKQWQSQLETFLDLKDEPFAEYTPKGNKKKKSKIGKIYDGKILRSGNVDIGLFQSLTKIESAEEILNNYGMVIVDEAHHVAAKTFEDVIKDVKSKYIYGLTATPKREDALENILYMRLGEISHQVQKEIPKHINQKLYVRFTSLGEQMVNIQENQIHDNNEMMVDDRDRNQQIVEDIKDCINENRHIIVLSRYVEHIDRLKQLLLENNLEAPIYILNSKMKTSVLKQELSELKKEGKPFVLLTTGSYAGEGFDLPALDTLMMVMPIKAKGSIQQYSGRLLRNLDEKEELRVYDYVDYAIPMFYRMYLKRLGTYKKLGYRLFEDEKTELYKSNIFEGSYETMLFGDLENAVKEFTIILPWVTEDYLMQLRQIHYQSECKKTIVITTKMESIFANHFRELRNLGFNIIVNRKVQQYFVIIDGNIVWMLPNGQTENDGEKLSLRIYSKEIGRRILRFNGIG